MKHLVFLFSILFFVTLTSSATQNTNIKYVKLTEKEDIFYFLFTKQLKLRNPNCHRLVFKGRSPQTMIAMGCVLFQLEIDKSSISLDKVQYKAMYQCGKDQYPFIVHCYLK